MTRVAYQGVRGAFGERAARKLFPRAEPLGVDTFEAVVRAVEAKAVRAGVLPVFNRILGEIVAATQAFTDAHGRVAVTGRIDLPVRLHLMARPGVPLSSIRRIASHPLALAQCRRLLAELDGVAAVEWFDSAAAAQAVAAGPDACLAAIASADAARVHGLEILRRDVQDHPENFTRFVGIVPQHAGVQVDGASIRTSVGSHAGTPRADRGSR